MLDKGIADRYAMALLGLSTSTKDLDAWDAQLDFIVAFDAKDHSLVRILSHPKVSPEKKKALVEKALGHGLHKHVLSLIKLMIDKGRAQLLIDVAKRFSQIADEVRGVEKGVLITAMPISDDLFKRLEEKVQKHSERRIVLERQINPSIIGGAIVKLGNHVYDGSVSSRLRNFRDEMKKVSVFRS